MEQERGSVRKLYPVLPRHSLSLLPKRMVFAVRKSDPFEERVAFLLALLASEGPEVGNPGEQ